MTKTRLTRDLDEAMLGGVLAGIAGRYGWDPTLLRIVAALAGLATGVVPGVLLYLVAWVIVPKAGALSEGRPALASSAAPDGEPAAESQPPGGATAVADEIAQTLRDAADRMGEAATIAAGAARQAANEIGQVARRPRAGGVADAAPSADEPQTAPVAGEADGAGGPQTTPMAGEADGPGGESGETERSDGPA